MKNITHQFGTLYHPTSALIFYKAKERRSDMYVEHFDMDENGNPINAHPLTEIEAKVLANALTINTKKERKVNFLKPTGILQSNILYFDFGTKPFVIWYTKARRQQLLFTENLEIPNGKAEIPALVWVANKRGLQIYALKGNSRPTVNTKLFHAPFFNVFLNGSVCMGNVDVRIKKSASIEEFISSWEMYFFNSYFSHLMNGHNPTKSNCVSLWKSLVNTDLKFPKDTLKPTNLIFENLII